MSTLEKNGITPSPWEVDQNFFLETNILGRLACAEMVS